MPTIAPPQLAIVELLLPTQLHSDAMAREKRGDWDGSTVIEDHLTFLRATHRMPNAAFVKVRVLPREEISPAPQGNERVIFRSHSAVASASR